jgi:ADP-heptose:LPS heptosyltransferase
MSAQADAGAPHATAYRKIVLIRTDRVGDLVLSTPAIASFRRSWPGARIGAVVTDYTEPVMRHNPDVDAVHVIETAAPHAAKRACIRRIGADADLVVALAPRTADYRLAAWTRAPRRIGYVYRRRYLSRLAARFWLTEHCISEADPDVADGRPDIPVAHEVLQVQSLVTLAGGQVLTDGLVLRTSERERALARERVAVGSVALNLSPRWFLANFGFDAVRRLVQRLSSQRRDLVVTYGTDVEDAAARLRDAVRAPRVVWLGGLEFLEWAATLARCDVVVTVDTGATHVASAMGVPVVVVYEFEYYRLSSQEWAPWKVPSASLSKPPMSARRTTASDDGVDVLIDDIVEAANALADERRR